MTSSSPLSSSPPMPVSSAAPTGQTAFQQVAPSGVSSQETNLVSSQNTQKDSNCFFDLIARIIQFFSCLFCGACDSKETAQTEKQPSSLQLTSVAPAKEKPIALPSAPQPSSALAPAPAPSNQLSANPPQPQPVLNKQKIAPSPELQRLIDQETARARTHFQQLMDAVQENKANLGGWIIMGGKDLVIAPLFPKNFRHNYFHTASSFFYINLIIDKLLEEQIKQGSPQEIASALAIFVEPLAVLTGIYKEYFIKNLASKDEALREQILEVISASLSENYNIKTIEGYAVEKIVVRLEQILSSFNEKQITPNKENNVFLPMCTFAIVSHIKSLIGWDVDTFVTYKWINTPLDLFAELEKRYEISKQDLHILYISLLLIETMKSLNSFIDGTALGTFETVPSRFENSLDSKPYLKDEEAVYALENIIVLANTALNFNPDTNFDEIKFFLREHLESPHVKEHFSKYWYEIDYLLRPIDPSYSMNPVFYKVIRPYQPTLFSVTSPALLSLLRAKPSHSVDDTSPSTNSLATAAAEAEAARREERRLELLMELPFPPPLQEHV